MGPKLFEADEGNRIFGAFASLFLKIQLALLLPSLTAPYVPLLTFGLVSLLGSGLALALPETAGHQLPDSFEEVKQTIQMMGVGLG